MISSIFKPTINWVKEDWNSHPVRFTVELIAWIMSIGANVMFALTVPGVPFLIYLTITVTGCALYAWAAWSRKSFGMLANYLLLTAIDSTALFKVISN